MQDEKISSLPPYSNPDAVNDVLPIVAGSTNYKISRNSLLGITSQPVGTTEVQTLTGKTLTSPILTTPVITGTITGTYTLGGTPTFPSTVVTTTGTQTLTGKTLTSPTINAPTITNASITADAISGFTSANTGAVYGVTVTAGIIASAALVNSVNTAAIQNSAVDSTKVAAGAVVQVVNTTYSAFASGATLIPFDDTIPQNTEGDQYMTQAITPKSTTDILIIDVIFFGSISVGNDMIVALFQDSTANALSAVSVYNATATGRDVITLRYTMAAGTTSSTTFKVRAGSAASGTLSFNGTSGARLYGATVKSSITIWEYKA